MDAVSPGAYARWRGTRLGELTERIERELVLDLAGPLSGRRVLDVGCGDGTYALAAASRGALCTAVDRFDEMLEAARQRALDSGAQIGFERGDANRLPFSDESFDVVLAVTVLCFVEDASRAVRELARVLVPGGRLVLADLNRWSTWAAWRRVRALFGSRTWRHARFCSAGGLTRLVTSAGLEVERADRAITYPPIESVARLLAPFDRSLSATTTLGAAFVAVAATRPPSPHRRRASVTAGHEAEKQDHEQSQETPALRHNRIRSSRG